MELLPPEVAAEFFDKVDHAEQLTGGELNATYAVHGQRDGADESLIVQRMSPVFNGRTVDDMAVVTHELRGMGWDVPTVTPTRNGDNYLVLPGDTDQTWRAMTMLPGHDVQPHDRRTLASYHAYGEILARLHADMGKIDYTPTFELPHFHDTAHHLDRLRDETGPQMPDEATLRATELILAEYDSLPLLPEAEEQLIHGDPRTANMRVTKGVEPNTFLDWDTIMKGRVWVDLGDLLRSLAEDAIHAGRPFPEQELAAVADGYRSVYAPAEDKDVFRAAAQNATKRIALELAARYGNDIVDDFYFAPDRRYPTRRDNHLARIATQMTIVNSL